MSNSKRISFIVFVLIGGTLSFSYWSKNEFDKVFNDLNSSYLASAETAYESIKSRLEVASKTDSEALVATSTNIELSLPSPKKGENVYIGCTYDIPLESTSTISSLEATLVDAGKREGMASTTSGLSQIKIEENQNIFKWKVGKVWPGEYYIQASKANGLDIGSKTSTFLINRMPEDIDVPAQKAVCEQSNGIL